ncbi:MAG: SDR family NAD(P)-dependent oxidoreductase, partial [Gaiellales bacterium]
MNRIDEDTSLDGRVAVVTGAGRGFGEQSARQLAALGAAVGIVEIEPRLGQAVENDLRAQGAAVASVAADVADADAVARAFRELRGHLGPIDILVNNAGIASRAPFLDLTEEDWDRTLAVNLTGA